MRDLLKNTTPGPWKVFRTTDGRTILGVGDRDAGGITDCGDVASNDLGVWRSGAEKEANAKLIAAAPELAAENERLRNALASARDVIATMADCLSPLVTEALVGDPLAEIDTALAHKVV